MQKSVTACILAQKNQKGELRSCFSFEHDKPWMGHQTISVKWLMTLYINLIHSFKFGDIVGNLGLMLQKPKIHTV